jgi:hypothetical protein
VAAMPPGGFVCEEIKIKNKIEEVEKKINKTEIDT